MNLSKPIFWCLLPELILAIGAHGAAAGRARRRREGRRRHLLGAISLLAVLVVAWPPLRRGAGHAVQRAFHGAFVADGFARFAKILILIGRGALAILCRRIIFAREKIARFELPVLMLLASRRHAADGVGRQLHRALYGAGAAEPGALCAGRVQPRSSALDRGGPQIFRPGRAVVGHAAVRHFADLRLHRHDRICGHRARGDRQASASA